MARYQVKIQNFEGPFDLLLQLVSKQKIDIGQISITEIIDQYLEEVAHLQQVDLDVASDFMLVAATLLKIKTDMLLKLEPEEVDQEIVDMSPSEAKEILIQRLLTYKQFKDASHALEVRGNTQQMMYPRLAGPDAEFLNLIPDFLDGVDLNMMAQYAVNGFSRRDEFLLDAAHIAAKPIPVVAYVRTIHSRIVNKKHMKFSELVDKGASIQVVVVNFLAMLELYKRAYIDISQDQDKKDIDIKYIEGSGELNITSDDIDVDTTS